MNFNLIMQQSIAIPTPRRPGIIKWWRSRLRFRNVPFIQMGRVRICRIGQEFSRGLQKPVLTERDLANHRKGSHFNMAEKTQKVSKLTEEQVEDFRKAFLLFDKDGNGRITADELIDVMRTLGQSPTSREVEEMIKKADQDGDGSIDFMEFLEVMAKKMGEHTFEDDLRDAFQLFDRDSNGYISKRELTFVMTSLGEQITDAAVENMIKEVDLDGDGRVNYEEFIRIMKK